MFTDACCVRCPETQTECQAASPAPTGRMTSMYHFRSAMSTKHPLYTPIAFRSRALQSERPLSPRSACRRPTGAVSEGLLHGLGAAVMAGRAVTTSSTIPNRRASSAVDDRRCDDVSTLLRSTQRALTLMRLRTAHELVPLQRALNEIYCLAGVLGVQVVQPRPHCAGRVARSKAVCFAG